MGMRYSEFLDEITVLYGGYVAEELIFGEVSTGPSNDLARITELARNMITKYGMSKLGALSLDKDKGMGYLGRDMMESKSYSEDMARQIDLETRRIIGECKVKCENLMVKYRSYLEQIAQNLLENEVLEFEEFEKIVSKIKIAKI
jgi:cell division protease FtsH